MELLVGETLADRLLRLGPLPLTDTLRIAEQLADALAAAHRSGVVHRDLKPSNIMLTRQGSGGPDAVQVKVLDFGLAKLRAEPRDFSGQSTLTDAPLTREGTFVGTLPYMAPEQLEGREVDPRADLFALGTIVYEMASGRRAFKGDSQASLIAAILERDPEPLSNVQPSVPPGLDRLVRKCLVKDPNARWQSATDVADELRWIAGGSGSSGGSQRRRRTARFAAIATALMLAGGGAAWRYWRTGSSQPEMCSIARSPSRATSARRLSLPMAARSLTWRGRGSRRSGCSCATWRAVKPCRSGAAGPSRRSRGSTMAITWR